MRSRKRPLHLLTLLSTILLHVIAFLWIASHIQPLTTVIDLRKSPANPSYVNCVEISIRNGVLCLRHDKVTLDWDPSQIPAESYASYTTRLSYLYDFPYRPYPPTYLGFGFAHQSDIINDQYTCLNFPLALPLLLSALLPSRWLYLHHQHRKLTTSPHTCPTCSYDTRATPHRCPECGTPMTPILPPP